MSTIAREIVILAACESNLTKDAFIRDESGFWEKTAQEYWDNSEPQRKLIDSSLYNVIKSQIATRLAYIAVCALGNEAKGEVAAIKQKKKR